jgi:tRNA(fMet)-specific endonuclease VapC
MVILDTDHASELGFRSAAGMRLLSRLDRIDSDIVITAITVEEQLRGWLAALKRHADPAARVADYARLIRQVELHAAWTVLPWDADAVRVFSNLRSQRIRIGTQDLKIAAVAIAHEVMLLTRNTVDFQQVPGLRFENWLD